jgi:hypothetical protein
LVLSALGKRKRGLTDLDNNEESTRSKAKTLLTSAWEKVQNEYVGLKPVLTAKKGTGKDSLGTVMDKLSEETEELTTKSIIGLLSTWRSTMRYYKKKKLPLQKHVFKGFDARVAELVNRAEIRDGMWDFPSIDIYGTGCQKGGSSSSSRRSKVHKQVR